MQSQFADTSKSTLWMGDLEPWMDENYIKQLWYSLGENVTVKMIRDKITGTCAGYCFVDFGSHASAMRQLTTVQGSSIPGTNRIFKLNWASGGGLVDNRRDAGPEYSIFVGDLGQEVNDVVLLTTFQNRYESTKAAKVVTDPMTGMSRGYGFVRFGTEIDMQRAMVEMNGQFCGSRPMRISTATPKNKMMGGVGGAAAGAAGMGMPGLNMGMGMGMMGMMGGPPQHHGMPQMNPYYGMPMQMQMQQQAQAQAQQQAQQQQQQQQQLGGASPVGGLGNGAGQSLSGPYGVAAAQGFGPFANDPSNTTVFIGGLSGSVSEEELRSHFAHFGEIVYTKIIQGKGCGFVQYSTRQSAEVAIQQMNNALIGGSRVRLSWGKSQATLKASQTSGPQDPIAGDTVDRMNENYIGQQEDSLMRNDIGGTGWRAGGQQQVFVQ